MWSDGAERIPVARRGLAVHPRPGGGRALGSALMGRRRLARAVRGRRRCASSAFFRDPERTAPARSGRRAAAGRRPGDAASTRSSDPFVGPAVRVVDLPRRRSTCTSTGAPIGGLRRRRRRTRGPLPAPRTGRGRELNERCTVAPPGRQRPGRRWCRSRAWSRGASSAGRGTGRQARGGRALRA